MARHTNNVLNETTDVTWVAAPTNVTVAGTTDSLGPLDPGIYHLISTTACYIRQGVAAVEAAATDHYLPAGQERIFRVTAAAVDGYVAALQKAAGGVLSVHQIGA